MKSYLHPSKHTERLAMEKTWSAVRISLDLGNSRDRDNNIAHQDHQTAGATGYGPVQQPNQ
jgi:hypothetical protein